MRRGVRGVFVWSLVFALVGASCGTSGPASSGTAMLKQCEFDGGSPSGMCLPTGAACQSSSACCSGECANQVCATIMDCCTSHTVPGCLDDAIKQCVCDHDPECCSLTWENNCSSIAVEFCCAICP